MTTIKEKNLNVINISAPVIKIDGEAEDMASDLTDKTAKVLKTGPDAISASVRIPGRYKESFSKN